MLKSKTKRSVARILPANAGRRASAFPAASSARANKPVVGVDSRQASKALPPFTDAAGGGARVNGDCIRTQSGVDLTEKIRELLLLAKEQGHLTHEDINETLVDTTV